MRSPAKIPILYVILGVLVLVSVVPMYFYANRVVAINRDSLEGNEKLLENELTRSLGEDIGQRQNNLRAMLTNFSKAVEVVSGGDLAGGRIDTPQLRSLLEKFVTSSEGLAYATLLNVESRGITAGRVQPDAFMGKELERAVVAASEGRPYSGQPLTLGSSPARTLLLVSTPLMVNGRVVGMIAVFEDLQFLVDRLKDTARRGGGLEAYVVDAQGRLVAGASSGFATGQDMTDAEIVKNFVEQRGRVHIAPTLDFEVRRGKERVRMLGTYSMVPSLGWAVVAQKPQAAAYEGVYEMQREMRLLALVAVLISVLLSVAAARTITHPIEVLTSTTAAISRGDFSRRVSVRSRTEIGELASSFNAMTRALEKLVADLKRAAEENRALFLSSIQMLAGAVDEKDPYTRGHSDRVTRYSVLIATEMGFPADEIEKIRVAAQLHDVGKIGIEDRVLKKPSALTPEEFSLMKAHATKGANILRPVRQLTEVLPGIELHHESMDGRGYPYGLKGEEIPMMARIIMVADTFDAMTTDRPYQTAMDPEYVVRMINSLSNTRFDPATVQAVTRLFERGELMKKDRGLRAAESSIS